MIIRSRMAAWPLAGLLLAVSSVHAYESPIASRFDNSLREEIVVTASREPRAAREVGSTLSWLDGRQIATRETPFAPELLREIPGLAVNRGGPVGGLTQIRMRGSEGNHTLVLIDGIEANDQPLDPNSTLLPCRLWVWITSKCCADHKARCTEATPLVV